MGAERVAQDVWGAAVVGQITAVGRSILTAGCICCRLASWTATLA
jgi:hypothetical protein